ncbi:MFS transporter [Frigidibacter sp. ROC022]|uniref:MFS transporter n=1 Tax=Frigidibacter sp. ROC022 TaxID=2971796 RepID=UPI00215A82B7|nr:MFS transporter [Frigidibacter sp. ROC022]
MDPDPMIANAFRLSRAPVAALTSIGVIWGGFAGVVPDLKTAVGASEAELGMALLGSAIGAMVSMYLAPRLMQALGRRALPLLGLALTAAVFYPFLAPSVGALALAMFAMGASVSMLDITANVRISGLESRHGLHLMNLNHAMFSVGFAGAALVTGLARKAGLGPWDIQPWLALLCLGLTVVMWEGAGRLSPAEPQAETVPAGLPWMAILLTGAILFAGFVGENATEAWSALHIEQTLGAPAGQGSFGPFGLGVTMAVGRFSGQFVASRIGEARLILVSALLGVVGALTLALAPVPGVAFVGVGLIGLGMAVIVPSVNSILGRAVREEARAVAISRAWMIGMIGFFLGPAMMGGVAELTSLRWSFAVVALVVAGIVPAVRMLDRRVRAARG